MKTKNLVMVGVVASAVVSFSNASSSLASKTSQAPSTSYEAWSTHKSTTISPERMGTISGDKSESTLRVKTSSGQMQDMKMSAPLGKL